MKRNIESDRVVLFEEWGRFRARLRQQRGSRKQAVQRSLVPMLTELLLELKEGFQARGIRCEMTFGRLSILVKGVDGKDVELGCVGPEEEGGKDG